MDFADLPAVVDIRWLVGDWEADLVMGKERHGAFVTLVERRFCLFLALPECKVFLMEKMGCDPSDQDKFGMRLLVSINRAACFRYSQVLSKNVSFRWERNSS